MDTFSDSLVVIDSAIMSGTYLLRIHVRNPLMVKFGRSAIREPVLVSVGEYVYVGSALGREPALLRRIVRHTSRSAGLPGHAIQDEVLTFAATHYPQAKIETSPDKKLFWHVDYLLDELDAAITQVFLVGNGVPLETRLATWLMREPDTTVIQPGLGATDSPSSSHLLYVSNPETWWATLARRIEAQIGVRLA